MRCLIQQDFGQPLTAARAIASLMALHDDEICADDARLRPPTTTRACLLPFDAIAAPTALFNIKFILIPC